MREQKVAFCQPTQYEIERCEDVLFPNVGQNLPLLAFRSLSGPAGLNSDPLAVPSLLPNLAPAGIGVAFKGPEIFLAPAPGPASEESSRSEEAIPEEPCEDLMVDKEGW